jgi:hypothetical protein
LDAECETNPAVSNILQYQVSGIASACGESYCAGKDVAKALSADEEKRLLDAAGRKNCQARAHCGSDEDGLGKRAPDPAKRLAKFLKGRHDLRTRRSLGNR